MKKIIKVEAFDSFDEFDQEVIEKVVIAKSKSKPVIPEDTVIDRVAERSVLEEAAYLEKPEEVQEEKKTAKKTTRKK